MALTITELHSGIASGGDDTTVSINVSADDLIIIFYSDDAERVVTGFSQTFLGGGGGDEYLAYYYFDSAQSGVITLASFGYQKPYKIFRVANFGATDWQTRVIQFDSRQNGPNFSYNHTSYANGEILSVWHNTVAMAFALGNQHTELGAELVHNFSNEELVVAHSESATVSATITGSTFFGFSAVELIEQAAPPEPSITDIDSDNVVQQGQTGVVITLANYENITSIDSADIDGEALTNLAYTAGQPTFTGDIAANTPISSDATLTVNGQRT